MLEILAAARCERGQRSSNQDHVRVARHAGRWIAVLADGAGGHEGGAEASRRAVHALEAALAGAGADFSADALARAVCAAHAEVQAPSGHAAGRDRMHTTVVALWLDVARAAALWAHVGDSRLYRVRHGAVEQLTVDDTVVQQMLDAGLLTPQQAAVHPQKHQLVTALGVDDAVQPHTPPAAQALQDGDAYLLCSDGWWGSLDDAALAGTLQDAATPDEWLAHMQRRIEARALPKQDNFSAIALWADDPAETTRPMEGWGDD